MFRRFRSIRSKLIAMILLGLLVPLGGGLAIFAVQDVRAIRNQILSEDALIATMIGEYSAADLAFENRQESEKSLAVLARLKDIEYAAVYDGSGELFSLYKRSDVPVASIPASIAPNAALSVGMSNGHIDFVRPVVHEGVRYGTLHLRASAAMLAARTRAYLWGVMAASACIVVVSVAVAAVLDRIVSRPVLSLAQVARKIAAFEDYSVRATKVSDDELGFLAEGFNAMLTEIERRQKQATEAIRVRDDFMSVASHELRTPITALKLAMHRLEREAPHGAGSAATMPDAVVRNLNRIERQVSRLESLVTNLLDVTRLRAGSFLLEVAEFELGELVHDVVERLSDQSERAGSQVNVLTRAPVVGRWDRFRIDQVVTNLLLNAVRYAGGKPIEVAVEDWGDKVCISVADHGGGVADAAKQKIFGQFERAPSTMHHGGLGLGLYISLEIVRAHGGSIVVSDTPGGGATFTVELPRS